MNRFLLTTLLALAVAVACSLAMPSQNSRRPRFDGRIVGGHAIDIKDAPHQISLQYSGYHMCGGSIIAPRYILTAAHCTEGMTPTVLKVRMGSSKFAEGGEIVNVYRIFKHSKYDNFFIDYDFSILQLENDIQFDETKQPIALPEQGDTVEDDVMLDVSGWGNTQHINESNDVLRLTTVPKVNDEECSKAYSGYGGITERMICAGYKKGGKDACQGDSGGPLWVNNTLVGVVSWGFGCAKPDYPGVYSRVSSVLEWINETIA